MKTNMKRAAFVVALAVGVVGLSVAPHLVSSAEASPASALSAAVAQSARGVLPPNEYAFSLRLNGEPTYLGTIDATTTSKTNAQATTPFNTTGTFLQGKVLLVQNAGTVSVRLYTVATSTGTASNTRGAGFGPEIQPGERIIITMSGLTGYLAAIATSSTASVDVWELKI